MANGRYKSRWFGWCELCSKRRIRIYWWSEDGIAYDTVCRRCSHHIPRLADWLYGWWLYLTGRV